VKKIVEVKAEAEVDHQLIIKIIIIGMERIITIIIIKMINIFHHQVERNQRLYQMVQMK